MNDQERVRLDELNKELCPICDEKLGLTLGTAVYTNWNLAAMRLFYLKDLDTATKWMTAYCALYEEIKEKLNEIKRILHPSPHYTDDWFKINLERIKTSEKVLHKFPELLNLF